MANKSLGNAIGELIAIIIGAAFALWCLGSLAYGIYGIFKG